MKTSATLLSIQVGRPQTVGDADASNPMEKLWTTSFWKTCVHHPVEVFSTHVDGDEAADKKNHGGADKAVCVYNADHYPQWQERLQLPQFGAGAFGENFTTQGFDETNVCIGDVWRIGDAVFEVTQPRQPCWKIARRWRIKELTAYVDQTGWSGWYLRVLQTGIIAAGMTIQRAENPHPSWTVQRANRVALHDRSNRPDAMELASLPALSESWVVMLRGRS